MCLNHHQTIPCLQSVGKLSSTKLVPDVKKFGDRCTMGCKVGRPGRNERGDPLWGGRFQDSSRQKRKGPSAYQVQTGRTISTQADTCLPSTQSQNEIQIPRPGSWPGAETEAHFSMGSPQFRSSVALVKKNLLANTGDTRDPGFDPWLGKIPLQ